MVSMFLCSCEAGCSQHTVDRAQRPGAHQSSVTMAAEMSYANLRFLKQSAKLLSDANRSDSHVKTDPLEMSLQALFWDSTNVTKSESKCPKPNVILSRPRMISANVQLGMVGVAVPCPQSWDSLSPRGAEGTWSAGGSL